MDLRTFLLAVWDPVVTVGSTLVKGVSEGISQGDSLNPNPTLKADIYASNELVSMLSSKGFSVYSEEDKTHDAKRQEELFLWLDPLDGSRNYAGRFDPLCRTKADKWSISVGCIQNGAPIAGIINQAAQGRVIYAARGEGAWVQRIDQQGKKVGTAQRLDPKKYHAGKRVVLGRSPRNDLENLYESLGLEVLCQREPVLTWKLMMLALGEAEVYCKPGNKVNLWDIAAADIILQEVGGRITQLSGQEIDYIAKDPRIPGGIIASRNYNPQGLMKK